MYSSTQYLQYFMNSLQLVNESIIKIQPFSMEIFGYFKHVRTSVAGTTLPPKDLEAELRPIQICHKSFGGTANPKSGSAVPPFFGDSWKFGSMGARSVDSKRIKCEPVEVRACIHPGSRVDLREGGQFTCFCKAIFVFFNGNFKLLCEELHFPNTPKMPLDVS